MNFQQITPFMHVQNLPAALSFFNDLLGFKTLYRETGYAYVHRETAGVRIMQNNGPDGAPPGNRRFAYYIDVRDVDALYSELKPKLDALPAGDVHGPADKSYGQRELCILAPDGNLFVFGQAVKKGADVSRIDSRLAELGVVLPKPVAPVANYVPYVISGKLVFISGQVSIGPNGIIAGKIGRDLDLQKGVEAAHACGVNLIAQLKAACEGDLDRVKRVVKIGGFVNCTNDFADQPKVVNGASDLMVSVFGDAGRHARAAVGAPSLPMNAAVEVDGIFEIA